MQAGLRTLNTHVLTFPCKTHSGCRAHADLRSGSITVAGAVPGLFAGERTGFPFNA
jgi:hypothetical protein